MQMTYINKEVYDSDFPNSHSYGEEITWHCHKTKCTCILHPSFMAFELSYFHCFVLVFLSA